MMPPSCNGLTFFETFSPFPWQYHPQMRKEREGTTVWIPSLLFLLPSDFVERVRLCHLCHSLSFDPLGVGCNLVGLYKANRHFPAFWLAKQLNSLPTAGAGAEGGGPGHLEDLRSPSRSWEAQALPPFAKVHLLVLSQLFASLHGACGLAFPSFPVRAPAAPAWLLEILVRSATV